MSDLVTVVIPALNEARFIDQCLDSVLAQSHENLEVLVIDGMSEDATRRHVERYASQDDRVRLLDNPGKIVSTGLNIGLAAAAGTWLVRIDAHASVPVDYVERLVAHLATGRWGGVGGRKDGVGITPAGKAIAVALGSKFGVGDSAYHHATELREVDHIPFGAYPTDLARELGGWDEQVVVNQDYEFDHRVRQAGYALLLDPSIVVWWYCRQSVPALFRQYRRYGRGKAQVARMHPESVQARHLAAAALVASWVGAVLAAGLFDVKLGAVLAAPYPLALIAGTAAALPRLDSQSERAALPAAFAAMHVGYGVGFWEGLLGGDPRALAGQMGLPRDVSPARRG